jgi:hypothetical protein
MTEALFEYVRHQLNQIEQCLWIVIIHYWLTSDKSASMLQCFQVILQRLEQHSIDNYRLEQAYCKYIIYGIKSELKLMNGIKAIE